MIYERVVQWLAGPFSAGVGVLATKAADHLQFLGQVGLGKSSTAHAIQTSVVFAATTGVTYLAHHKWLTNLAKWWDAQGLPSPEDFEEETSVLPHKPDSAIKPDSGS